MPTVEETVDFLLKNPARRLLEVKDIKLLVDLRRQTWWSNLATITTRQQELVLNIVSKYLLVLKSHNWPVDELVEPQWKTPVRQSRTNNTWTIELDQDRGVFVLAFPYDTDMIRLMRSLESYPTMIDKVVYHKESVSWLVDNGVQGRNFLQSLLRHRTNWQVPNAVYQTIMQTDRQWPLIRYINGQWHCDYASESFQQAMQNIVQQDLSILATAVRLCSLQPEFDYTVHNVLKNWLRASQIEWLLDTQTTVELAQFDQLIEMIQQVDLWPAIICDNKYNKLMLHEQISNTAPTQPLSAVSPDQIQSTTGFLTTRDTELDRYQLNNQRVPWIIYSPSYMSQYGVDDTERVPSCVHRNFDKPIAVVK
jgi:hypothetical protein